MLAELVEMVKRVLLVWMVEPVPVELAKQRLVRLASLVELVSFLELDKAVSLV